LEDSKNLVRLKEKDNDLADSSKLGKDEDKEAIVFALDVNLVDDDEDLQNKIRK